ELVGGRRNELDRLADAVARLGERTDAVGRVHIVRDRERVAVPVDPVLVDVIEHRVAVDPGVSAPGQPAASAVAALDRVVLLDDVDLLRRCRARPGRTAPQQERKDHATPYRPAQAGETSD